jgi:hypothetical protein
MFFPQPRPLVTGELMPLVAFVTWPLTRWPLLANNAASALALLLDCVAGASFARAVGARGVSCTAAGIAFAFWAYTCFVVSRVQLLCIFPAAFALAAVLRWARSGSRRDAVAAAIWSSVQPLTCLYYGVFLALVLPAVVFVARLAVRRAGAVRDLLWLGTVGVLAALPVGLLLWPYATLKSDLGLFRPLKEQIDQSGDPRMFFWADSNQIEGRWLIDRMNWDTAFAPGVLLSLICLVGLALWIRRGGWSRVALAFLGLASLGAAWKGLFPVTLALWGVAVAGALVLARRGSLSPVTPAILALVALVLFLFAGARPNVGPLMLGETPYHFLYDHLPVFSGLRMIRRIGFLWQLALVGLAAVTLSRLERRRFGRPLVVLAAFAMLVDGMPFGLSADAVPAECTDPTFRRARDRGIPVVADIPLKSRLPDQLGSRHHLAALCGVATSAGYTGFQTPLTTMAIDAEASLPDPAAHAWLWDADVRHAIVRGHANVTNLRPITEAIEWVGDEAIIDLKPPPFSSFAPGPHLAGPRIEVAGATVSPLGENPRAVADGLESTRWGTRQYMTGRESIMLHVFDSLVTGIEWHAREHATDLPRGLRIERQGPDGQWVLWRDLPSLSPIRLGRSAAAASYAIPLPPERVSWIRLTQTGMSRTAWLSASEIEVVGGPPVP